MGTNRLRHAMVRPLGVAVLLVLVAAAVVPASGFANLMAFKTDKHFPSLDLHDWEFYSLDDCPQYYKDRYGDLSGREVEVVMQSHSVLDESLSGANVREVLENKPDTISFKLSDINLPKDAQKLAFGHEAAPEVDPEDKNLLKNVPAADQEKLDKQEATRKHRETPQMMEMMNLTEETKDDQSLSKLEADLAKDPFAPKKAKSNLKGAAAKATAGAGPAATGAVELGEEAKKGEEEEAKEEDEEITDAPLQAIGLVPEPEKKKTPAEIEAEQAKTSDSAVSIARLAQLAELRKQKMVDDVPFDFKAPKENGDDVGPTSDAIGPDAPLPPLEPHVRSAVAPSFVAPAVSDALRMALPPPPEVATCNAARVIKEEHRKEVRASVGYREKLELQCFLNKRTKKVAGIALVVPVSKDLPSVQSVLFDELGTISWDYGFIQGTRVTCAGEYICLDDFYKSKMLKAQQDHHPVDPTFNLITEVTNGQFCIANVRTDNQQLRKLYYVIPNHMDGNRLVFAQSAAVDGEHI